MEARDERASLGAVGQELRTSLHGHAGDRAAVRHALGDHRDAGIPAQVTDLLRSLDTDHRERRRIVQEPHRHRQRCAIGLHGGEHGDLLRRQESLDARVVEAQRGVNVARPTVLSTVSVK